MKRFDPKTSPDLDEISELSKSFDIEAFLANEQAKDLLRFTTAGSVDDGKSTLIGRLLHDAKGAYEDQLKQAIRGGEIDFSLLTDGLRAEREQGITIDVAYRYFATPKRKFILADTPGPRAVHAQHGDGRVDGRARHHSAGRLARHHHAIDAARVYRVAPGHSALHHRRE